MVWQAQNVPRVIEFDTFSDRRTVMTFNGIFPISTPLSTCNSGRQNRYNCNLIHYKLNELSHS